MNDVPPVILVQPKTGILSEIKSHPSFPMALMSAARDVTRDFGVRFIDQRVEEDWKGRLRTELDRDPVCVGITSITGSQLHHALEIGRFVKKTEPAVPVVWGGVHVTLLPDNTLEEPTIDVVVRGEGEETFVDLLHHMLHGTALDDVPGISFRRNDRTVHTEARDYVDLDGTSPLPYHLPEANYLFLRKNTPSMYLETSRGCPFRCAYCYNASTGNRRWRAMSPSKVLASMEDILRAFPNVGHLSIVDDNYFVDLDRVREISRRMVQKDLRLSFQVQGTNISTVKRMSGDDLSLLRRSGCERLDMGVESGSEKVLREIQKDVRIEDVREANLKLKAHNIQPWFNFMSGFPMESDEDLKSTVVLMSSILKENKDALLSPLYCFTPYPGNKLFEKALNKGFLPPGSIDEWADYGWDQARLPWLTRRKVKVLESLYFLSIFIDRKVFEYRTHGWLLFLALLYKPVASTRFRHRILGFMAEKWLYQRFFEKKSVRG